MGLPVEPGSEGALEPSPQAPPQIPAGEPPHEEGSWGSEPKVGHILLARRNPEIKLKLLIGAQKRAKYSNQPERTFLYLFLFTIIF